MSAHFLGYGFTKPIDDLSEHDPPSHPELLDGLAERFREQSFDLKELRPLDRALEALRPVEPGFGEEREGRSDARREAEVLPLLPAADAGGGSLRVAAHGHRSR